MATDKFALGSGEALG
jgi:ABC-type Zn uptake system ZnuABC Zn-binding protein ZnuA